MLERFEGGDRVVFTMTHDGYSWHGGHDQRFVLIAESVRLARYFVRPLDTFTGRLPIVTSTSLKLISKSCKTTCPSNGPSSSATSFAPLRIMDAPQAPAISVPDFTFKDLHGPQEAAAHDVASRTNSERMQTSVASLIAAAGRCYYDTLNIGDVRTYVRVCAT